MTEEEYRIVEKAFQEFKKEEVWDDFTKFTLMNYTYWLATKLNKDD